MGGRSYSEPGALREAPAAEIASQDRAGCVAEPRLIPGHQDFEGSGGAGEAQPRSGAAAAAHAPSGIQERK